MSKSKKTTNTDTEKNVWNELDTKKNRNTLNSSNDYSTSSMIARAYSVGYFPSFTYQRLFHTIVKLPDGKNEGSIDFKELLTEAKMHKSSALQIIRHMVNFSIIEVSFNTSHVIGECRKPWAHIKILRDMEYRDLAKSA